MKRQKGFSLMELVLLIVIISILATGSLVTLNTVLTHNSNPGQNLQAAQVADASMSMIILTRWVNGFGGITDPCNLTVAPACAVGPDACQDLCNEANNMGLTITTPMPFDSGTIGEGADPGVTTTHTLKASVNVTGTGNATNVVEFIQ